MASIDSIQSFLIPRPCLDQLASSIGVQSGLSSGFAWVLHGDLLDYWRYSDGRSAEIRSLRLPQTLDSNAPLFVSILPQGKSSRSVSVLICSPKGAMAAWTDASNFNVDPTLHSLIPPSSSNAPPILVTSFSAAVPSEASGHQAAFLAAAGLSDGSWALIQGSISQGILSKRINQKPTPSSLPHSSSSSSSSLPPLLNKITSAVAWGLQEAFDPSAKILKKTPGLGSVMSIQILSVDSLRVRVLVLYESTLDCWQVNLGLRPSELLAWSFCNLNVAQSLTLSSSSNTSASKKPGPASRNALLSNLPITSPDVKVNHCYVWMVDPEGRPRHYLQKILMDSSGALASAPSPAPTPIHDWCIHVDPFDSSSSSTTIRIPLHLSCHVSGGDPGSCLMMAGPGRIMVECFVPPHGEGTGGAKGEALPASRLLSEDPDNLAITHVTSLSNPPPSSLTRGAPAAAFAVLSTTYGVIELPSSSSSLPSLVSSSTGPLTPDQVQQVFQLLETTCRQALLLRQQQQQRGQGYSNTLDGPQSGLNLNLRGWPPLRALVSGLERRLSALGALSPLSNQQVLLDYSSHLCNMSSSEWAQGSLAAVGGGGGNGISFHDQLRDKGLRHESLLACLTESGLLRGLDPTLQVSLVENQEKVACALAFLALQSSLNAQLTGPAPLPPSLQHTLSDSVELVEGLSARSWLLSSLPKGSTSNEGGSGGQRLQAMEMFYSQPTLSTPHLFKSLSEASVAITRQFESDPGSKEALLMRSRLSLLSQVLGTTIFACNQVRSIAQGQYRMDIGHLYVSLGRPGWWQGAEPRSYIESLLEGLEAAAASLLPSLAPAAAPGSTHPDPSFTLFGPLAPLTHPNSFHDFASSSSGLDPRDLSRSMFGVTEILFSAHAAAVSSAPLSPTLSIAKPKSVCLSEYREARKRHAPLLYSLALAELPPSSILVEGRGGGAPSSSSPSPPLDPDALLWHLEDLFSSHHCYPELFAVTRNLAVLLHRQHQPKPVSSISFPLAHHPAATTPHGSGSPAPPNKGKGVITYSRMHSCMSRMVAEEGAPDRDTFSNYVFQQLLDLSLSSELLTLPMDKFKGPLVTFLQPHPQLMWILKLLHNGPASLLSPSAGPAHKGGLKEATLALARTSDLARQAKDVKSHYRLECLAMLSSYADQDAPSSLHHASLLRLVGIQRKLSRMSSREEGLPASGQDLMSLEETVDLALSLSKEQMSTREEGGPAALLALESLLVCPRAEREVNQERWKESWHQLLISTDWPRLGQDQAEGRDRSRARHQQEGEGGEEGRRVRGVQGPSPSTALATTPLYLGTLMCGGKEAMGFSPDGTFNPQYVKEVRGWLKEWCVDLAAAVGDSVGGGGREEGGPAAHKARVTRSSRKAHQSPSVTPLSSGRVKRVVGEVALDPEEERQALMDLPLAAFDLAVAQISIQG